MDYENKYKKALERAKKYYSNTDSETDIELIELIFPELINNKDEKIRKELIRSFKSLNTIDIWNGIKRSDILAWLEKQKSVEWTEEDEDIINKILCICNDFKRSFKISPASTKIVQKDIDKINTWLKCLKDRVQPQPNQGEQNLVLRDTFGYEDGRLFGINEGIGLVLDNPEKYGLQKSVDKVEPKFKVGDWIVDKSGFTQQVLDFRAGIYTCTYNSFTTDCESNYHLWTIADAEDGDVLADNDGVILFRKIGNKRYADVVDYYFVVNTSGRFEIQKEFDYWGEANDAQLHPATKEQRDTLLKAMADAGYTFDFNKKKLKKIK